MKHISINAIIFQAVTVNSPGAVNWRFSASKLFEWPVKNGSSSGNTKCDKQPLRSECTAHRTGSSWFLSLQVETCCAMLCLSILNCFYRFDYNMLERQSWPLKHGQWSNSSRLHPNSSSRPQNVGFADLNAPSQAPSCSPANHTKHDQAMTDHSQTLISPLSCIYIYIHIHIHICDCISWRDSISPHNFKLLAIYHPRGAMAFCGMGGSPWVVSRRPGPLDLLQSIGVGSTGLSETENFNKKKCMYWIHSKTSKFDGFLSPMFFHVFPFFPVCSIWSYSTSCPRHGAAAAAARAGPAGAGRGDQTNAAAKDRRCPFRLGFSRGSRYPLQRRDYVRALMQQLPAKEPSWFSPYETLLHCEV